MTTVTDATKRLFSLVQEICKGGYTPAVAIQKIETLFQLELDSDQRNQITAEMHRRYRGRKEPWVN